MSPKKDEIKEWFEAYALKGMHLFPVSRSSKKPCIKDMLNQATTDIEKLMSWNKQFCDPNWGLSLAKSGLISVDIDRNHNGLLKWAKIIEDKFVPPTLGATSGGGGIHLVFSAKPDIKFKGKIDRGIDIKHNGYILVQPSRHPEGGLYRWNADFLEDPKKIQILTYPEWLAELIEKRESASAKGSRKRKRSRATRPDEKKGHDRVFPILRELIHRLREFELDYEEWVTSGMAIHSSLPNSNGLDLFVELTSGISYEDGDEKQATYKWDHFTKDGGVSLGSLFFIAEKKGINISSFVERLQKVSPSSDFLDLWTNIEGKLVTKSTGFLVSFFNGLGYCFIEENRVAPFARIQHSSDGRIICQTFNSQNFREKTAPYFLSYDGAQGKVSFKKASEVWISHHIRKTYKRFTFKEPGTESDGELNLFRGFPPCLLDGRWSAIEDLVHESLCGGDDRTTKFFLDYFGHLMQKPFEKTPLLPVLIGPQGTGKNIFCEDILGNFLGDLFFKVGRIKDLEKRFNEHLSKKFLILIDEGEWNNDRSTISTLKQVTGSRTMTVEEKGGAVYNFPNVSRYILTSNDATPVGIEPGDRRICLIYSSEKYAANPLYFGKLWKSIEEEQQIEKFFNHLCTRDLSDFDPHKPMPKDDRAIEAILAAVGPIGHFWFDQIFESTSQIFIKNRGLHCNQVYQNYTSFLRSHFANQPIKTSRSFWSETRKLIKALPERHSTKWVDHSRVREIYPDSLIKSFCHTLGISPPADIDYSVFYMTENFNPKTPNTP